MACGLQGKTDTSTLFSSALGSPTLPDPGSGETRVDENIKPHHGHAGQAGQSPVYCPVEDGGEPVGMGLRTPPVSESPLPDEWVLHPEMVQQIRNQFRSVEVDLFAS